MCEFFCASCSLSYPSSFSSPSSSSSPHLVHFRRDGGEGSLELEAFVRAKKWRCGVQSADISDDGNSRFIPSNGYLAIKCV